VQPEVRQKFSQCALQVALRAAGSLDPSIESQRKSNAILLDADQDPLRGLDAKARIPEKPEIIMKR
jgi:hypothetical protein